MYLELKAGVTLYFCRHAQTEANAQNRLQGWTRDTPLTEDGRGQAKAAADILQRELGNRPNIECVSSSLPRARSTMELIRSALSLPPENYRIDERINEIKMGSWDGLTHEEARAADAVFFDKRAANKWDVRLPGGENYTDVAVRAADWVKSLETDTFAVTHGAFTRILRGLFCDLDRQGFSELDEPHAVIFRVRSRDVTRLGPLPKPAQLG